MRWQRHRVKIACVFRHDIRFIHHTHLTLQSDQTDWQGLPAGQMPPLAWQVGQSRSQWLWVGQKWMEHQMERHFAEIQTHSLHAKKSPIRQFRNLSSLSEVLPTRPNHFPSSLHQVCKGSNYFEFQKAAVASKLKFQNVDPGWIGK